MTIMQDNDGNLVVLDKDGEVVVKAPRTRPAYTKGVPGSKFSEELVSDIHQLARQGTVLITRKDHEESRF
jgi:hypothetical protein